MRSHLRWVVPLLAAPAIYVAALWGASVLSGVNAGGDNLGAAVGALGLWIIAIVGPVIALILAIVGGVKVNRAGRRSRGRYTKTEARQRAEQHRWDEAWERARELRERLVRREVPEPVQVWDVVANPGEVFFFDLTAEYFRFYGQDVSYSDGSGFYYGRPAFVIAGLGIAAISNSVRRSAARQQAAAQWRERQVARVLVSNQRLVCSVGGRWLSFHFAAVSAVYPEVAQWTLVLQFESAEPLMLRGSDVPSVALLAMLMTHGVNGVRSHPNLRQLGTEAGDKLGPSLG